MYSNKCTARLTCIDFLVDFKHTNHSAYKAACPSKIMPLISDKNDTFLRQCSSKNWVRAASLLWKGGRTHYIISKHQ